MMSPMIKSKKRSSSKKSDNETVSTVCESPSGSLHSFDAKGWYEKPTDVHFATKPTVIQEDEPTVILSDEEVNALWYTPDEYRLIRNSQYFAIKMLENKECALEENDELCSRGLESRTKAGARRKRMNIAASWDAVLYEQEKQWDEGRYSPTALAKVYRDATAQCEMVAFLAGKRDAQFVQDTERQASSILKLASRPRFQRNSSRRLSLEKAPRSSC